MRLRVIVLAAATAVAATGLIYGRLADHNAPVEIKEGQAAPDFVIRDERGQEIRLSDFRGKVVLLHFWATWCPPCVDEIADVELVSDAFTHRQFQVIGISQDRKWGDIQSFYQQHHLTLPS